MGQKELVERYLLGAWFVKIRLMSSRRQLWANEASLIHLENSALQLRKICEMISYMCIAAAGLETGTISRSLKGYKVGSILRALEKSNTLRFPRHARLSNEQADQVPRRWKLDIAATHTADIARTESIHERTHKVLHEFPLFGSFPNQTDTPGVLIETRNAMRADHQWLWNRFWQHAIFIGDQLLFVDFGDVQQHDCPTIMMHEGFLNEDIALSFDANFLADFTDKINWAEYE